MTPPAPERIELVEARLNSLAAKHLYTRRIGTLRRASTLVDYLTIAVPILYFPIRYIAKGTSLHGLLEAVWEVLAAILVAAALVKVFYRWSERFVTYLTQQRRNTEIAASIQPLLAAPDSRVARTKLDQIRGAVINQDVVDLEELGNLGKAERQWAYREALKELVPGDVSITCPVCHASPWSFTPGDCSACGNTNVNKRS
jgi:mobilome CxxCx(11)CxxC protein